MVDRLVAVDDADYRLPEPVLDALATDLANVGTSVGAAIGAAVAEASIPGPVVATPAGFGFSSLPLPTVYRLGGGRFSCDLDVSSLRPPAGVTYYVSPNGSDANSGSSAFPITLPGAYAKADVGTIACLAGEYFRNTHTMPTTWTKSINLIAVEPGVKITGWNSPSSTIWTVHAGSVYKTSRSLTVQIVDVSNRTAWGDHTVYEQVADAASVTAAGKWAIVGSDVYVWPIGGTDLTVTANRFQIRLGLGNTRTGIDAAGSATVYTSGISFEGNELGGITVSGDALVIAEDWSIRNRRADGVVVTGGRGFIGIRGEVTSTGADGLSYSHNTGTRPDAIEIDVVSHHTGTSPGASTNNPTTGHVDVRILRINGSYEYGGGPIVADVNSSKSWNLGLKSGNSTAPDSQRQSYRADGTGFESDPAEMWLDECEATNNLHAFKVTGGGKIHVHRPITRTTNVSDVTSGVIDMYLA